MLVVDKYDIICTFKDKQSLDHSSFESVITNCGHRTSKILPGLMTPMFLRYIGYVERGEQCLDGRIFRHWPLMH